MRGRLFLALLAAAGMTGAALTLAGVRSPATGPLTLLFLLYTPAICVALLLTGLDALARAIVAGAAALVLAAAVAEVMLVTAAWSPRGGVAAVTAVCALLATVAALKHRRHAKDAPESPRAAGDDEDAWAFES